MTGAAGKGNRFLTASLISWFIDSVALWVAMQFVPGLHEPDSNLNILVVVALFGLVNVMLRHVFWLLTFPLIWVTLPPLVLTFNALVLWTGSWVAGQLGLGFIVDGFVPALLGATIMSIFRVIALRLARIVETKRNFRKEQACLGELDRTKVWLEEQQDHWRRLAAERGKLLGERRKQQRIPDLRASV